MEDHHHKAAVDYKNQIQRCGIGIYNFRWHQLNAFNYDTDSFFIKPLIKFSDEMVQHRDGKDLFIVVTYIICWGIGTMQLHK